MECSLVDLTLGPGSSRIYWVNRVPRSDKESALGVATDTVCWCVVQLRGDTADTCIQPTVISITTSMIERQNCKPVKDTAGNDAEIDSTGAGRTCG